MPAPPSKAGLTEADQRATDKKSEPGDSSESELAAPVFPAALIQQPLPPPSPPLAAAAIAPPTKPSAGDGSAGIAKVPATASSAATAGPAASPSKASADSGLTLGTEPVTASRVSGQAAAATQAGLSVDTEREGNEPVAERHPPGAGPETTASHDDLVAPAALALSVAPAAQAPPQQAPVPPNKGQAAAPTRLGLESARTTRPETTIALSDASKPASEFAAALPVADLPPPTPNPAPSPAASVAAPSTPTRANQPDSPIPSPAAQVAQALVEPIKVVLSGPNQAGPTTPHVTTIQITPVELGRVDVRIERSSQGPARIQLVVERPETLSRLVHDQSQLQQALDSAGIPPQGRTIDFSLAPQTTGATALPAGTLNGNDGGNGAQGQESHRQGHAYDNQGPSEPDGQIASIARPNTYRIGIDITA
ncbi:MAG: flagellar hook-length control protein FliK [Acetobacteraceae bacterium]|nr:flagellar hook-length control protein FliK [Acetobacteraceae bacterium]